METPRFRRIIVEDEERTTYLIRKKNLILRISNDAYYDYYVHYPYLDEKVKVIRILKKRDNPDLSWIKRLVEISDGVLFNTRYLETLWWEDNNRISTSLDGSTNLLPVLKVDKDRVKAFQEAAL